MRRRAVLLLVWWGMLGCAAQAPAPQSEPAPADGRSASAPAAKPEFKTLPDRHTDFPLTVTALAEDETPFTRELEAPVHAIAIDKEPHVSALGDRMVHVHDGKGWREEPLPDSARSRGTALSLFYGRDYRVRLVGTRQSGEGLETLYYRWLPGGFRAAPDEIGRLGSTRKGGFVALLGTADPEVVCRPRDVCLIKRLSGWATIAAPAELELVAIHGGGAWAVAGRSLLAVESDKRWKVLNDAGPWKKATTLWVDAKGSWVLETDADQIHHFDGAKWSSSSSPSKRPRALWSAAPGESWLGGDEGLFRSHGGEWRKVSAISGSVTAIAGRGSTEVWVGGSTGLLRTTPR